MQHLKLNHLTPMGVYKLNETFSTRIIEQNISGFKTDDLRRRTRLHACYNKRLRRTNHEQRRKQKPTEEKIHGHTGKNHDTSLPCFLSKEKMLLFVFRNLSKMLCALNAVVLSGNPHETSEGQPIQTIFCFSPLPGSNSRRISKAKLFDAEAKILSREKMAGFMKQN